VVWINVGRREKRLLFLIRKRDEPVGKPIAIWGAVYEEFGLKYDPYKPKCSQEAFLEERYIRRAFERIFKRQYAKPAWTVEDGFSLTSPRGEKDFDCCILTPKGRRVAEQLKRQEQMLKNETTVVRRVLDGFRALGWADIVLEQIREGL
jgi:hypothetical protein